MRAETIAARIDEIKRDYPPVGRLSIIGHAHIDLAWLWPMAETRRKNRRTFNSVLMLMDHYPDFTFNQSSAQVYAWLEEEDPELLERIKQRVAEGRWELIGGSWLEPDGQVTGGEAYVRQLFYGQRYFEKTFGRRSTVAWLPDVFGFSAGIPQVLRGAGLTGFFTIKLNWNEVNVFPYDLFEWVGLDGTSVTAHMFFNPGPRLQRQHRAARHARDVEQLPRASGSTRRACSRSGGATAAAVRPNRCWKTTSGSRTSRPSPACAWGRSRSTSPRSQPRGCRAGSASSTSSSTAPR